VHCKNILELDLMVMVIDLTKVNYYFVDDLLVRGILQVGRGL
jgi:hypothetical protein